eukprot:scaffold1954_cov268-Pinguiococcus_pyrenoidosus.AAC.309
MFPGASVWMFILPASLTPRMLFDSTRWSMLEQRMRCGACGRQLSNKCPYFRRCARSAACPVQPRFRPKSSR